MEVHKINSSFEYLVSKNFRHIIVKFVICLLTDICTNGLILVHIYAKRMHNWTMNISPSAFLTFENS